MKVNQPIVSKFIQCTNKPAWFSFVGKIEDDQGFYCFSKVPDFVCCLAWDGRKQNKSGKSGRVPELLRWWAQTLPTSDIKSFKICTVGRRETIGLMYQVVYQGRIYGEGAGRAHSPPL